MKLICPSCGAIASAEAWNNDVLWREMMRVVASMPVPVATAALGYFSLFRPGKSALSVKKALRLAKEIRDLAASGHVQVQGKVARPCPARIWAAAMEQMIERRDSLRLPLKNHNYLLQIAWGMADEEDSRSETARNQAERSGDLRPVENCHDDGLLPMERILKEKEARLKAQGNT